MPSFFICGRDQFSGIDGDAVFFLRIAFDVRRPTLLNCHAL